ncbi:MAG: cytidine deaminase [Alphaproteobacteria bacterium]|nr:cytidine deaminase [Alphaproteobacteria bacterium]
MKKNQQLLTFARQAMQNAYAPYSKLKVGAAILTPSGNIYTGCNVENISYPCGNCAETGAISTMVTAGEYKISKIAIISNGNFEIKPCGACLQRIKEFSNQKTEIITLTPDDIIKIHKISELLPTPFEEL